jgi:hypothetical protein
VAEPACPRQVVVLPTRLVVRRSCGCREPNHNGALSEAQS